MMYDMILILILIFITGRAGGCPKRKVLTPFGACCALGKVPRTTSHRTSVQGSGDGPFCPSVSVCPNRAISDGGKKKFVPRSGMKFT